LSLKISNKTASKKRKNPGTSRRPDNPICAKIESLLHLLESEISKHEGLRGGPNRKKSNRQIAHDKPGRVRNEDRIVNKRIVFLQKQIVILHEMQAGIHENFLIQDATHTAAGFQPSHDFNSYLSRFIDIDIRYSPSIDKLREIGKNIHQFFLNDRHCSYIFIQCSSILEDQQNLLRIVIKKNREYPEGVLLDRNRIYYYNLEDSDLPERKLGRIIIGRHPYKSPERERSLDVRMKAEILVTKRLLEKYILEIQNKELAIKDGLTGLYSRKFFIERLSEEFKSLDIFSRLNVIEYRVLKTIMKSEGIAAPLVRNHYFVKYKTKDEVLFDKALHRLKTLNLISTKRIKYLGEPEDSYAFENSKMSDNFYLAILDIDRFKSVNDNWGGHLVGDRILRDFAAIIKKNIRTIDIPARYGGDEFIIIFPRSANYLRIFNALEKIRLDSEEKLAVFLNGKRRSITVSIGVTQISKFDLNIYYILNRSDSALYKAKKKRNRTVLCIQSPGGELRYQ
jgi:diguanylate cyclase (GGDEF)-like protein